MVLTAMSDGKSELPAWVTTKEHKRAYATCVAKGAPATILLDEDLAIPFAAASQGIVLRGGWFDVMDHWLCVCVRVCAHA